jgi:hypothetical protein
MDSGTARWGAIGTGLALLAALLVADATSTASLWREQWWFVPLFLVGLALCLFGLLSFVSRYVYELPRVPTVAERRSRVGTDQESASADRAAQLDSALKGGHVLHARLQLSNRRDKAWFDLCDEIDDWTFGVQQLLFVGATEFLNDFDGDWKPSPLQSRDQISEQLRARLQELAEIVKKLGG